MSINFHDEKNRFKYAKRQVDSDWFKKILEIVNPQKKHVIDIGCGGGIYTRAWAQLGTTHVLGLDFSEEMIQTAIELSVNFPNTSFLVGNAISTGLEDQIADIVFERALIHHIADISSCINEVFRLLRSGGMYIIQDRTPEDVAVPASKKHVRGYFFEKFPFLLDIEYKRRPKTNIIQEKLKETGFREIKSYSLWETRKIYQNLAGLTSDLRERTGRSILHEISNKQLEEIINYISFNIQSEKMIIEKDRWTIWSAIR
ncbi:MAG: class I SAM-dependent methyltransferase [Candidatus Hodarchaeales archaeon]|jgi:ubiquinone/menaquinone biosynthesis C-methylase UbiE